MRAEGRRFLRGALLLLVVLAALAAVGVVLWRTFGHGAETAAVVLPPPRSDEETELHPVPYLPQTADVTPETAAAVLRTVSSVRSYSRTVTVETFWEEGSGTETIVCRARDDALRLCSGGKNLLVTPDGLYVWYDDAPALFSAPAADAERTRYMRLLDWETLLAQGGEIVAAAYTAFEGAPCVYLSVRGGAFDYVSELYVSVENGLLLAADTYEEEKCVYRMRSGDLDISTPDAAWFTPPAADGG